MKRAAILVCICCLLQLAVVSPARGLSCGRWDARNAIAQQDAALIGRVLFTGLGGTKIAVEHDIKQNLPRVISIHGWTAPTGQRVGLFPYWKDGRWNANECSDIDPGELLAGAQPLLPPDGAGRLAYVATGFLGSVKTIGLDERGKVLAYGMRGGGTMSLCPESRILVEVTHDSRSDENGYRGLAFVVARDLHTFDVTTRRRFRVLDRDNLNSLNIFGISCLSPDGHRVGILVTEGDELRPKVSVFRVEGSGLRRLHTGRALAAAMTGGRAYVADLQGTVQKIEMRSGSVEGFARVPRDTKTLAVSPDEQRLAITRGLIGPSQAAPAGGTLSIISRRASSRTVDRAIRIVHSATSYPILGWSTPSMLVWRGPNGINVFDRKLKLIRLLKDFMWPGIPPMAKGEFFGFMRVERPSVQTILVAADRKPSIREIATFDTCCFDQIVVMPTAISISVLRKDGPVDTRDLANRRTVFPKGGPSVLTIAVLSGAVLIAGALLLSRIRRSREGIGP